MKFKNGQLPTWYVTKLLMSDEELYATAPDTPDLFPCEALTDGIHIEFITYFPEDDGGSSDGAAPIREDWTLKRKGGGRVNKREEVVLGKVNGTNSVVIGQYGVISNMMGLRGTHKIVARKIK